MTKAPSFLSYGTDREEVEEFVDQNSCVATWLSKYAKAPRGEWLSGSRLNKARILSRFFKWLKVEKGITLSPKELLNLQLQKRQSNSVEDRQWLLNLVLEHSRDNPDFKSYSDIRKYNIFNAVKVFCGYHEVSLTTAKGIWGKKKRRRNHRRQITLAQAKKFLGKLRQRERTIFLIMLQSGMEIGAVLNKFSYMWHDQVKPQLEKGCERLKIEFNERKGNNIWYFTYISRDGVHELRKWLQERTKIIEGLLAEGENVDKDVVDGNPMFITSTGNPLTLSTFLPNFGRRTKGKITTHMFRKLFKSEASVPDRGIDRNIVEFWMGHINGIEAVGGEYDRTPEIYEEIFEKEYAKLEPYINIYSGNIERLEQPTDKKLTEELKEKSEKIQQLEDKVSEIETLRQQVTKLQKDEKFMEDFLSLFYFDAKALRNMKSYVRERVPIKKQQIEKQAREDPNVHERIPFVNKTWKNMFKKMIREVMEESGHQ